MTRLHTPLARLTPALLHWPPARPRPRFRSQGGTEANVVRDESDRRPDCAKIAGELLALHPRGVLPVCGTADAAFIAQQLRQGRFAMMGS